ncbi:MAG TPA: hypothetical protein VG672_03745, partial [Bryobacteraceae bacterium]|nr:hypothetical protein [Bryobacteraceae bacterium]
NPSKPWNLIAKWTVNLDRNRRPLALRFPHLAVLCHLTTTSTYHMAGGFRQGMDNQLKKAIEIASGL